MKFDSLFKRLIFFFTCLPLLYLLSSGCSSENNTKNAWTVMVYLDGDNNLEHNAIDDFNEMEQGLYDAVQNGNTDIESNLSIIVLIDRAYGIVPTVTDEGGSDWYETRMYRIRPDNNPEYFASERLDDNRSGRGHTDVLGELNMGDPATLSFFTEHAKAYFPADHYALILWNHGDGIRKKTAQERNTPENKGICTDSDNGGDILYTDELQKALEVSFNSDSRLDILGFDACYMAMLEVGYEYRNLADYMIASMYAVQTDGWSYDLLFGSMSDNSDTDESTLSPESFSRLVVSTYKTFIDTHSIYANEGETLSVSALFEIQALADSIDTLGVALYDEDNQSVIEEIRDDSVHFYNTDSDSIAHPYYDLYSLCRGIADDDRLSESLTSKASSVIDTLASVIVCSYGDDGNNQTSYYGNGQDVQRGLSVFFSRGDLTYNSQSHYTYQWWYTQADTVEWAGGNPDYDYGHIDFCFSNNNGSVEGWRELMEAWYDPSGSTPDDY